MRRRSRSADFDLADLVAVAAGTVLGLAVGFVAGGAVGRVNKERLRTAFSGLTRRAPGPGVWTEERAQRLEAGVLDALARDVVLARRRIKVTVLGMGLVELSGTVLHIPEIGAAGDIVQGVDGVRTVLNHLVVEAPTPGTPRAARG